MVLTIKQLKVGKIDGKHEYLIPLNERDKSSYDAFLIPESVEPNRIHNGDMFYISGFRGTGKTSLLRWHAEEQRKKGSETDFILFKTDLTETQRMQISKEADVSWPDLDAGKMGIAQDFKVSWMWFVLHKIGEHLKRDATLYNSPENDNVSKIITLLGLADDSVFRKVLGYLPKLEGANVSIKTNMGFFEAELGGDFAKNGDKGSVTLDALMKRVLDRVKSIQLSKAVYIYFDELEAFYHTPEQHRRDQQMVRDLLFAVEKLNSDFRNAKCNIHIIAAVRSEVVGSMGSLGQEVDRLVYDKGFLISWHHAKKSLNHPLIKMIRNKIRVSELEADQEVSEDGIATYFPENVDGVLVDTFLLDRSFYKPRDIVWRLSIAQKLFPSETYFSEDVLKETEVEYSSRLWDEVRYELSAVYSTDEVDIIEEVLSGSSSAFYMRDIENRFSSLEKFGRTVSNLLQRRSVREVLQDLYRLGAIGNIYRVVSSGSSSRYRWSFRGDPTLLTEQRMVIHGALSRRLSVVAQRKRGSRGSGHRNH